MKSLRNLKSYKKLLMMRKRCRKRCKKFRIVKFRVWLMNLPTKLTRNWFKSISLKILSSKQSTKLWQYWLMLKWKLRMEKTINLNRQRLINLRKENKSKDLLGLDTPKDITQRINHKKVCRKIQASTMILCLLRVGTTTEWIFTSDLVTRRL